MYADVITYICLCGAAAMRSHVDGCCIFVHSDMSAVEHVLLYYGNSLMEEVFNVL